MCHTQLTREEQYQIHILKKAEYRQTRITGLLEHDKLTISRELRRSHVVRLPTQADQCTGCGTSPLKYAPRIGQPVWQQDDT